MTSGPIRHSIRPEESGRRLDSVLSEALQVPRNQIQQWIRQGHVRLGDATVKPSHPVSRGETYLCDPPLRDLATDLEPDSGPLEVVYEDDDLVVVDKPVGLVVHPGAGRERGTLVHRLLARYPEIRQVGGQGRPGIVHRLDKDTSGLVVVSRTPRAYEALSESFAERRIDKRYLALVYGSPRESSGRIEVPIGRHPHRRKEMTTQAGGRPALTLYRCLASAAGISAMELDLATGRTHQIRVHLKSIGHPLIGDPVYGEARWKGLPGPVRAPLRGFPRPALHAWRLELEHPVSRQALILEAPLPEDMRLLWEGVTGSGFPDPG